MDYDFGYTNDKQKWDAANAYREAAVNDGWEIEPTHAHEPITSCATLKKNDFVMMINTRTEQGKWKYVASVHIWGPDKKAIEPGDIYNWNYIQNGLSRCNNCGVENVKIFQYSFAGRCCEACLPEMRKQHEYPGWTN
jgi:hypothetical protein